MNAISSEFGQLSLSRPARVGLINMPFARTAAPSIQCGILKAQLARAGHIVDVHYLNLELSAQMGAREYESISDGRYANALFGEWLFSAAAFGYCDNEAEYLATYPGLRHFFSAEDLDRLLNLRRVVFPAFIEKWAKRVDWSKYDAVGFTSTFAQNNAAFALARAIKSRHPQVLTMFGGANFSGGMGLEFLRKLPFIDYVVDGEAEEAVITLADRIAKGESGAGVPGVSGRHGNEIIEGGRTAKIARMDVLADPDYDEYFETMLRLGRTQVMGENDPMLLLETARGCWWGEKHHCTFCGLNANDMNFRSKSPERVLEEFKTLTDRYQTLNIEVVDNIINVKYVDKVCKPLIEQQCDYTIFWEVKANLSPTQLRTMATAGIIHLQPGIESLSTHVLDLMRKGITMIKNVRFLKWAAYFGISPRWNMLTGFPGETVEDYEQQRRLIPLLKHLNPPGGWGPIWLERYSPYFFDPSFPVEDIRPGEAYRFIYPGTEIDLSEVAYFFEYKMKGTIPHENHEAMYALLKEWKLAWEKKPRPALAFRRGPDWIEIVDQREEKSAHHWLYGVEAFAYEACCETDRTADAVARAIAKEGEKVDVSVVEATLKKCCDLGVMIEEGGHYLGLALPLNRNWFLELPHPAQQPAMGLSVLQPVAR